MANRQDCLTTTCPTFGRCGRDARAPSVHLSNTLLDAIALRCWAIVPETVGHFGAGFGGRSFPSERRGAAPRPAPTATRPCRPNPALPALPAPRLHRSRRPIPRRRPFYRPSREPPSRSRPSLSPVHAPAQPVCGERFVSLPECRAARSCAIRIRRRRREGGSRLQTKRPRERNPSERPLLGRLRKSRQDEYGHALAD